MDHLVTHGAHRQPRHFGMRRDEIRIVPAHPVGGLAENFDGADNRVERLLVLSKGCGRGKGRDIAESAVNRLDHMAEVIFGAIRPGHRALASARTRARNAFGRESGVRIETRRPSRVSASF